jgi:hypothetical protein
MHSEADLEHSVRGELSVLDRTMVSGPQVKRQSADWKSVLSRTVTDAGPRAGARRRWVRMKRGSGTLATFAILVLVVAGLLTLSRTGAGFTDSTETSGSTFTAGKWGGFEDRMAVWAESGLATPASASWDGFVFGVPQRNPRTLANCGSCRGPER